MTKLSNRPQNRPGNNPFFGSVTTAKHKRQASYLDKPSKCRSCQAPLPYEKRSNKFCDRSCAAKFNNLIRSDESRQKQAQAAQSTLRNKSKNWRYQIWGDYTRVFFRICKKTGSSFVTTNPKQRTHSSYAPEEYRSFRIACEFKFHTSQYPNLFNLDLIDRYGWYHPVNNPIGVTRDHMFTIKDGYELKVSPEILSHPANCKLMLFSDNSKKGSNSSITLAQLMERIERFGGPSGA